jgi:hypothetical protein
MTDMDTLRRQYEDLRAVEGPFNIGGPLVCAPHITLLPLRYGIVADEDVNALAVLPTLPAHLARGLPQLTSARYAVRPLRAGYLYGLIKRGGQWSFEIRVQVQADGRFKVLVETDEPCERPPTLSEQLAANLRPSFAQVRLHTPDGIEEARFLFTPDPLTRRTCERLEAPTAQGTRLRATWQRFNLRKLAYECGNDPDTLTPDALGDTVADWTARGVDKAKAALRTALSRQLFARDASADGGLPDVGIGTLRRDKGVALVLHDAIGITQELNAWRNGAIEQVRTGWMVQRPAWTPVDAGVDNERALLVAQGFSQVEALFQERMAAVLGQHEIDIERARADDAGTAFGRGLVLDAAQEARFQAQKEAYLAGHAQQVRARYQGRLASGEFQQVFQARYATRVNWETMRLQEGLFDGQMAHAQAETERRAVDHRRWMQSPRLLEALDQYDETHLGNGLSFAEQTGRCVLGMESCKPDADQLERWWKGDALSRENLALRGYALNQRDMRAKLNALLEAARSAPPAGTPGDTAAVVASLAKELGTAFDKANALYETLHAQGAAPSVGAYAWFVALGRNMLRTAAPNAVDRAAHTGLSAALRASVGSRAVEMRLADLAAQGQLANPNRVASQVYGYLDRSWAEGVANAHRSGFYKVRAASALCLLEAGLMLMKAQKLPDSDARQKTELAAAALTTAAAGFEIGVNYVEQAATRHGAQSVTGKGALVVLGRMKLWGAGLATMGGFVIVAWDFKDGRRALSGGKSSLADAYFVRAGATITLSIAELCTAIAIAKPYFEYLVQTGKSTLTRELAAVGVKIATRLGTHATRALLGRLVLGAFWIGSITTALIWIFDDNALEKWCQRCLYRLDRSGKPYPVQEELSALYAALNEVV